MKSKSKSNDTKTTKTECDGLSYEDCELAILRSAINTAETIQQSKVIKSPELKKILSIVEKFIQDESVLLYGGTAINNILPKNDRFYDPLKDIPDYDFYSSDALHLAKKLTDIYVKNGFVETEAKSGQHYGTFKVFVNFIPVADITQIHEDLFKSLVKKSIEIDKIKYSPPDFLRMNMYLELSRPRGDVSRWEKVVKRLALLNKHYPLSSKGCSDIKFQRDLDPDKSIKNIKDKSDEIFDITKAVLVSNGVVFFGGYAMYIYSKHMPKHIRHNLPQIPDFDAFSENAKKTAEEVKKKLIGAGFKDTTVTKHDEISELVGENYEIMVGDNTIAFIYEPLACHSYNFSSHTDHKNVKVASIDTMLSVYLVFLYIDRSEYNPQRILCMAKYLFEVEDHNKLAQTGILKRFSDNCMGHQTTITEMREEKAKKFIELRNEKNTTKYEEWFLRYRPSDTKKGKNKKDDDTTEVDENEKDEKVEDDDKNEIKEKTDPSPKKSKSKRKRTRKSNKKAKKSKRHTRKNEIKFNVLNYIKSII